MISVCLYFLFSAIDIKDLMSYEFIRVNKDVILKYKNENFLFLTIIFFTIIGYFLFNKQMKNMINDKFKLINLWKLLLF